MSNIEVNIGDKEITMTVNDQALIRRYEKCCGLDEKKIESRIADFLSRN